ncbi:MAG: mechanosensitive ion channel domain-containing protein [Pseudomonadota bacterium]
MMRRLHAWLSILGLLILAPGTADALTAAEVVEIERSLSAVEGGWESLRTDQDRLLTTAANLEEQSQRLEQCVRDAEAELGELASALAPALEPGTDTAEQRSLVYARLQDTVVECRVLTARVSAWQRRISESLTQERSLNLIETVAWWRQSEGTAEFRSAAAWLLMILLATLPLAFRRRAGGQPRTSTMAWLQPPAVAILLAAPGLALAWILDSVGVLGGVSFKTIGPFLLLALLTLGALDALAQADERRLPRSIGFWILLMFAAGITGHLTGPFPDPLVGTLAWDAASALPVLLLIVAGGGLLMSLRKAFPDDGVIRSTSMLLLGLMGVALVAWFASRINLAWFLVNGLLGTVLWLVLGYWLFRLLQHWLDQLDVGESRLQRWLRRSSAVAPGQPVPGVGWLRISVTLGILLGLVTVIDRAWRLEAFGIPNVEDLLRSGVQIGQVQVVPWDVFIGVLVFALLLTISQRIKNAVSRSLVKSGAMGLRSADAVVTVFGYIGAAIAALIGLSVAGFSFGSLAVIAGALSVGIGFGLQNIVNNFVSGLILLFERPIKQGDWVKIGDAQGLVTRIKVRSTEIQQFDRSELIVPNSELVAGRVTNMTLHDAVGRLIIPVGVAYGSDVEQVREILWTVVRAQPAVIQDGRNAPKVLFWAFGDSALEFEVRCYLRDIGAVLDARSDLHFAIERALREADIEIPFPQRVVHMAANDRAERSDTEPGDP